jgi:hypothetical protein
MKTTLLTALSLLALAACGGNVTSSTPVVELPADCAPSGLGCFSSCPDGVTCAYVYTGEWPDPGSSCAMFECASHPVAIDGCTWVEWSDIGTPQSSTEGFVCGDGPSPAATPAVVQ